mmetsp:Transcript_35162/g.88608  ORF Transcript_35162/g.88608 Transcript_35162/m.88608 type:complete len:97 (-) Transcript_35162:144-434(-)
MDYGAKQGTCDKGGSIVVAATTACWDEPDCDSMTKCFSREACKHHDMTDECHDELKVCRIKPGGTIYQHTTSGSHVEETRPCVDNPDADYETACED